MFQYQFDWSVVLTGQYAQWIVDGIKVTIQLSAVSIALSFLMGLLIAVMRMSQVALIRGFAHGYLEFIRNTPLLVQFFFWYFGSYQILPQAVNDWLNARDFEFAAAVIALTIYTSAFIAEDIRSGIRSIPKEQMEAARSSGFSYVRSMHLHHPAPGRAAYHPAAHQPVSQPDQELVARHDDRRGGAHVPGKAGGKLHLQRDSRPSRRRRSFIWSCRSSSRAS